MNIYTLTKLVQELEEIENPYPYDIELLKFYKNKKEMLIKKINKKKQMSKSKIQFEHLQNKRKTQREREAEREQKRWDEQSYPLIGKINLF